MLTIIIYLLISPLGIDVALRAHALISLTELKVRKRMLETWRTITLFIATWKARSILKI